MAEYTCCSSVVFERPKEYAFTLTRHLSPALSPCPRSAPVSREARCEACGNLTGCGWCAQTGTCLPSLTLAGQQMSAACPIGQWARGPNPAPACARAVFVNHAARCAALNR
jgi:hypothetical protein